MRITSSDLAMFSPLLQAELTKSGWSPDRKIDIAEWKSEILNEEISLLPEAIAILENFGGLTIIPARSKTAAYVLADIAFDPLLACDKVVIEECEKHLSVKISPLGETSDQIYLLLADDRSIYGSWGNVLFKYGDSFEDALENTLIFAKRKPPKIATFH